MTSKQLGQNQQTQMNMGPYAQDLVVAGECAGLVLLPEMMAITRTQEGPTKGFEGVEL